MRYLSVCSGIEAASVAWHGLGWEPVGFSEIEKFPSQVLATRFPGVKNYGDMTRFKEWDIERGAIDVLVGGTPCQAFSVAGLRKGLSDPRGNLALTFVAMVEWHRPEWVVWENVPGVLSSNGGRDFGAFLGALGELGYGWSYRVLDAQYYGVAQRRRRVFVVAHASGDARRAAEVLFEPSCLRGDPPPRREAREGIAGDVVSGTVSSKWAKGTGGPAGDECYNLTLAPAVYESHPQDSRITGPVEQSPTVAAKWGTDGNNTPLVQQPFRKSRRAQSTDDFETWVDDGVANTVNCFDQGDIRTTHAVAVQQPMAIHTVSESGDVSSTLRTGGNDHADVYNVVAVQHPIAMINMQGSKGNAVAQVSDQSFTLNAMHGHDVHAVVVQQPMAFSPKEGGFGSPAIDMVPALRVESGPMAVAVQQPTAFAQNQLGEVRTHEDVMGTININANASGRNTPMVMVDAAQDPMAFSWQSGGDTRGSMPRPTAQLQRCQIEAVLTPMAVRRLTPVECERLQGFPDGWTDIKPGGKDTPDSPRYKSLGNSMAVPVMRWIGERIEAHK